MKTTLAIVLASLFSAAAWAGSPFLDISATNTFRSAERAVVEAAVVQAEAEGKLILIDMAAAWCGPCLALDKEMEARKAEMEPVMQNYIYVKLEEMHLEQIYGADFLGFEIAWFPSLFILNPITKKWTALGATNVDGLKQVLTDYKTTDSLGDLYVDRFMTELRAGRPADFNAILDGMIIASTEFEGAKYLAVLKELTGIMDTNPALFNAPVGDMRMYLSMANSRLLDRGVATIADLRAADAQAYAGYETDAGSLQNINFGTAIGVLIRTQGNFAAADQCAALNASTTTAIAATAATDEDKRYLLLTRDIQCLLLDVQVGRKTGVEARAYHDTMTEGEQRVMSESLMKLFATTGTDFDLAIKYGTIIKTAYENAFKNRPELLARVTKATSDRLAAYAASKSHP